MPAECFFLDVAQGTSQIIYLGQGRAIVIDGGPSAGVPLTFLDENVETIVALIVSHNDADHHLGACGILTQYQGRIDKLYFLEDRRFDQIGLLHLARQMLRKGSLGELVRLERNENYHYLYRDEAAGLFLELLFPTFEDNLAARQRGGRNEASAVLALHCGSRRVVFSGDATLEAWRRIHDRLGGPLRADILTIPHHGGVIWPRPRPTEEPAQYESRVRDNLRWLYREACHCNHVVISVGSSNPFSHPHEWVVEELSRAKALVLCTQMTCQCADNLEEVRLVGIRPLRTLSRSTQKREVTRRTGRSRNVACAGTVVAEVGADSVLIAHLAEHQAGVDRLRSLPGGHPLCRRH
jgi:hypothetical protein